MEAETLCIPGSICAVTRLLDDVSPCDGEVLDPELARRGELRGTFCQVVRFQLETTINNRRSMNLILAVEGPSFLYLLGLVVIAFWGLRVLSIGFPAFHCIEPRQTSFELLLVSGIRSM